MRGLALLRDDVRQSLEAQIPFPSRLARPEEYAALVKHIVENPYLNAGAEGMLSSAEVKLNTGSLQVSENGLGAVTFQAGLGFRF